MWYPRKVCWISPGIELNLASMIAILDQISLTQISAGVLYLSQIPFTKKHQILWFQTNKFKDRQQYIIYAIAECKELKTHEKNRENVSNKRKLIELSVSTLAASLINRDTFVLMTVLAYLERPFVGWHPFILFVFHSYLYLLILI